jgi:glycerol kinase
MREATALGAAIAAGLAVGLWRSFTELRDIHRTGGAVFEPNVSPAKSADMVSLWEKAVHMSQGWVEKDTEEKTNGINGTRKLSSVINHKALQPVTVTEVEFSDLDDADEEYLLLELRKIEIQKRLNRLRRSKA